MRLIDFRDIESLPIDFESIVDMLVARIKEKLPNRWTDFLASNYGMEIIEAVAYECMLLYFNTNATINEAFLATAKTQTAVYRFAKSIGYKPHGPSQATTTVRFYITEPHTRNITIPRYTRLSAGNSYFYTTELATINVGSTYVDVEAKSGSIETDTFISTGVARYEYKLAIHPVNAIESVLVNTIADGGVEYTYTDFIDINDSNGTYYTVSYDEEFYGYISFGDGTYGVNPSKGVTFDVTYVANAGMADNVAPYAIDTVLDTIYDSVNRIMDVRVTNPQAAVGGGDAETVEETKQNIPAIYRAQERLVTMQDFKDLVGVYPGVKKVGVIDHTVMDDIGIFGVKLVIIPEGGYYLNQALRSELEAWVDEKKIIATQVSIIDPTYISFNVTVNVKLESYANSATVLNNIRAAIHDYLYWENREFGQAVDQGEIYSRIRDIDGVISIANITLEESSGIYVAETPTIGTNVIHVIDKANSLASGGTVSIMTPDGEFIVKVKISEYNKDESTIAIVSLDNGSPYLIEDNSTIVEGCLLYPSALVDGNYSFGDKEITLKDYVINEVIDNDGNYITSEMSYTAMNLSYMSIYFGNINNDVYRIMYVSGNTIYLDRQLELDINDGTEITFMSKKYVPMLASSTEANATQLKFSLYPRFGLGATLIRKDNVAYNTAVTIMTRSILDVDYMSSVIDTIYLVRIDSIFINSSNVFVRDVDYVLRENDRVIEWTAVGQSKITANTTYYVQYVRKILEDSDNSLEHYVLSIDGKIVEVDPPIPVQLQNGTAFEYESDIFRLMPYEIADQGTVTINIL